MGRVLDNILSEHQGSPVVAIRASAVLSLRLVDRSAAFDRLLIGFAAWFDH